jgi:DNA-binding NtrC family response regulator
MAQAFTVLFVDDDDRVRGPVAHLLELEGFRVLTASSALQALRILAREHVDVLFTDVVMPDIDGIALAKEVRALQPGIRILFATGYYSQAANAAQLGKLVFKPVRAAQIGSALRELMQDAQ